MLYPTGYPMIGRHSLKIMRNTSICLKGVKLRSIYTLLFTTITEELTYNLHIIMYNKC